MNLFIISFTTYMLQSIPDTSMQRKRQSVSRYQHARAISPPPQGRRNREHLEAKPLTKENGS